MRKVEFGNGEFYHIYNRGVDKRNIFLYGSDYERFLKGLVILNDIDYQAPSGKIISELSSVSLQSLALKKRQPYVDILAYCLMPNHYHLFLRQAVEKGITKFLHKLGTSYTNYFNLKCERSGRLFEGPFKAIHVNRESYYIHLPCYVHLNILDLLDLKWREKGIEKWTEVQKFLKAYKWSSHPAYLGEKQSSPIINIELVKSTFANPKGYLKYLQHWTAKNFNIIKDILLE